MSIHSLRRKDGRCLGPYKEPEPSTKTVISTDWMVRLVSLEYGRMMGARESSNTQRKACSNTIVQHKSEWLWYSTWGKEVRI
jgi:hypothetical protein